MNQRLGKIVSALALLSVLVALGARAAPPPLLVVEVSEGDHVAAQRLLELTEQPTQLVRMPEARDPARTLPLARAARADRVVVFDRDAQRVVVLSTRDGSALTRGTETSDGAPFMAAFVAVELLALPAAEPAPAPAAPPSPPSTPRASTELGARAGLETLVLAPYRGALRPAVGLFVSSRRPRAALGFRLELWAAPHATHGEATAQGRLALTRDDVALRAGALWSRGRLSLSWFGQLGFARMVAAYASARPEQSRRAVLALGLGVEPSVTLFRWLALYAAGSLLAHAPPAEYRFAGQSVLREPRLALTLGAGVCVKLPI